MAAAAGFEHDPALWLTGKKRRQLRTLQRPTPNLACLLIDPVHLHHVFRYIQAKCRNIHLGPPSLSG